MANNSFIKEVSQELARFDPKLLGMFRCPVCLRDLPIENFGISDESTGISEEHIIPAASGGKLTTLLCKRCNSSFGHKQTAALVDWIELNESGVPFHKDPKKQRAKLTAGGVSINGEFKKAKDGTLEFYTDRKRSNPKSFDEYWNLPRSTPVSISHQMPVFKNENLIRVGLLTAAYGLWFKNFCYSWVLQSCQDIVRRQILNPDSDIMNWEYTVHVPTREINYPCIGVGQYGEDCFPIALIYDHLVILPSPTRPHPLSTPTDQISHKMLGIEEGISDRFQSRCVGPATLIYDGHQIINPDMIAKAFIPPQHIWLDRWP